MCATTLHVYTFCFHVYVCMYMYKSSCIVYILIVQQKTLVMEKAWDEASFGAHACPVSLNHKYVYTRECST